MYEKSIETTDYEERHEPEALSSYGTIPFPLSPISSLKADYLETVIQCCGIVNVEGTTVSNKAKVFQALHGIYISHPKDQHALLLEDFPTHLYRVSIGEQQDNLVELSYGNMGFVNEYDVDHLVNAFLTLYPYSMSGLGSVKLRVPVSWERQVAT